METKDVTLLHSAELFDSINIMLQEGYDAEFTVVGNSMWPFLSNERDRVIVRARENSSIKKGDIVLFCPEEGRYLLHRVTQLRDGMFQTAGDGNCFYDGFFPEECLNSIAISFRRKEKFVSCQNLLYRIYSKIWMFLFPIRRHLLRLLRFLCYTRSRRKRL